eukprot:3919018-Prymnesium_polylepis.1
MQDRGTWPTEGGAGWYRLRLCVFQWNTGGHQCGTPDIEPPGHIIWGPPSHNICPFIAYICLFTA